MDIWRTRRDALELLGGPLSPERDLLASLFSLIKAQVRSLQGVEGSPLARAGAAILGKAHRLSVGLYSLQLDALVTDDPSRIIEIEEDRLPRAGVIAKRIDGKLKDLRDHLSEHASHFAITPSARALGPG